MRKQVVLLTVLMTIGSLGATACGASAPATEAPAAPTVASASTPEPATATESPAATPVPSTATEEPAAPEPPFDGAALLQERCTVCHDLGRVEAANKTADEWRTTIGRMIGKGAKIDDAEKETLIEFLAGS